MCYYLRHPVKQSLDVSPFAFQLRTASLSASSFTRFACSAIIETLAVPQDGDLWSEKAWQDEENDGIFATLLQYVKARLCHVATHQNSESNTLQATRAQGGDVATQPHIHVRISYDSPVATRPRVLFPTIRESIIKWIFFEELYFNVKSN